MWRASPFIDVNSPTHSAPIAKNAHNHRDLIAGVRSRLSGQRGQFPAKFERETAFYGPRIIHNPPESAPNFRDEFAVDSPLQRRVQCEPWRVGIRLLDARSRDSARNKNGQTGGAKTAAATASLASLVQCLSPLRQSSPMAELRKQHRANPPLITTNASA